MITKDSLIGDIIMKYPKAVEILMNNGMGCVGCPSSQIESIDQAAAIHGMDIEKLLEELNKAL
ncbi:DUF1858 domain-containing protein [Helicovermis profundi]|uniref:DUF1858 domain-containing protein n=2 Tax=Helicovermis profundi TaxID=3065157 RepID=A0AAU9EAZ2_9FIRM|nr:DUF1858 domain-containing protein [Clostridia bacterium S502]